MLPNPPQTSDFFSSNILIYDLNECLIREEEDFINVQLLKPFYHDTNSKFCLCSPTVFYKSSVFRQSVCLIDSDYLGKPVFRCLKIKNVPAGSNQQIHLHVLWFFDADPGNLASFSPTLFSSLAQHHGHVIERFSISSLGANGIDVTLQNDPLNPYFDLPAQGCLQICLPFLRSFGFRDTPNLFVLRSRFSRLGCDLVHLGVNNKLLVRNLSNQHVTLGTRFLQIVPPWPWNFSRLPLAMHNLDLDKLIKTKWNQKKREEKEF